MLGGGRAVTKSDAGVISADMSVDIPRSDGELLVAARSDPAAFGLFYERHVGRVVAFFRARVGRPEVGFDLTAETFAAALGAVGRSTRREEPAAAWLFASPGTS